MRIGSDGQLDPGQAAYMRSVAGGQDAGRPCFAGTGQAMIGVGLGVLVMMTIQQRQQRMNRQINQRLKTLRSA